MNIAQIEEAVQRGLPFRLKGADGDEFFVPHPDYIFLPPTSSARRTYVIVHNDQGFASILPLLTITSLTFQPNGASSVDSAELCSPGAKLREAFADFLPCSIR